MAAAGINAVDFVMMLSLVLRRVPSSLPAPLVCCQGHPALDQDQSR
jgi:hypothetical protein